MDSRPVEPLGMHIVLTHYVTGVLHHPWLTLDGFAYYEYFLVYVDDILIVSHNPDPIVKCIEQAYCLKEPASDPKHFLGSVIKPWSIPGVSWKIWSMAATKYIEGALRNLKIELDNSGVHFVGKPATPMRAGYCPELDTMALLSPRQANYYMSLIWVLQCTVELGGIDIYVDVALLSSHMAAPCTGHMEQVLHNFSYLKNHLTSNLVFDPNTVAWDESMFKKYDWMDFYRDAHEAIPPNAPPPRGNEVQLNAFVDDSHASNKVTYTGILIYLNMAPIIWYSKKQNTVESSTFGSEFIAMLIGVEMLESLCYKIRMFSIPLEGAINVFCDTNLL
jgi:hypothetical protein